MVPLLWRRDAVWAQLLSCTHRCALCAEYVRNGERVEAQSPIGYKWDT